MESTDYHYSSHRSVETHAMPCHAATVIEKVNDAYLDAPAMKTIFDVSLLILIRRLETLTKNQAKLIPNNHM